MKSFGIAIVMATVGFCGVAFAQNITTTLTQNITTATTTPIPANSCIYVSQFQSPGSYADTKLCPSSSAGWGAAFGISGGGISALTGPVTASGSGSVATTITPTGVTAGTYTNTNLTVNAAGQITSATNGSGGGGTGFSALTGGTNTSAAMVVGTGASLGASGSGSITATSMAAGGLTGTLQAAQFPALTGDVTTTAGALGTTLATVNSNVGSFTNANITVNAKGLITAAANGSGGGSTTITLNPGLATTPGTYNTGAQTATNGSTISNQFFYEAHSTSYTVLSTDGAKLLTATGAGVTFTAPNPGAAGASPFQFGNDGTHTPIVTTVGGTAIFYGCSAGAGGTSMTIPANVSVQITPDGTNYQCAEFGGGGGGSVSLTAATPNLVFAPSTITSTGTIGSTNLIRADATATPAIVSTDATKEVDFTASSGSIAATIPVASTSGFTTGFATEICTETLPATLTPTTSTINGQTTLTLNPWQCADIRSDSTNYLAAISSGATPYAVSWTAGQNPNNAGLLISNRKMVIVAIVGNVETAVGATATIALNVAASGTACSSGTALTTANFDANSTAATNQVMTLGSTVVIPSGSRVCLQTANGSAFTAGTGSGQLDVFARAQ